MNENTQETLKKFGYEVKHIKKGGKQEFPEWTKTLEKITAKELMNKEFVILEYVLGHSKKYDSDFAVMRIAVGPNEERQFATSSTVLIGQLEENKDNLPLLVKLSKVDKYYIFE